MSTTHRDDRPLATELKFLIVPELAAEIRTWARQEMAPDPYAAGPHGDTYQTTTLYFDTPEFDVYHRRGSFGRSKYRVRQYGASDMVFLERKMRTRDRLAKRRTLVPIGDVSTLGGAVPDRAWSGAWLHRRLLARALRPVCRHEYGGHQLPLDERLEDVSGRMPFRCARHAEPRGACAAACPAARPWACR